MRSIFSLLFLVGCSNTVASVETDVEVDTDPLLFDTSTVETDVPAATTPICMKGEGWQDFTFAPFTISVPPNWVETQGPGSAIFLGGVNNNHTTIDFDAMPSAWIAFASQRENVTSLEDWRAPGISSSRLTTFMGHPALFASDAQGNSTIESFIIVVELDGKLWEAIMTVNREWADEHGPLDLTVSMQRSAEAHAAFCTLGLVR